MTCIEFRGLVGGCQSLELRVVMQIVGKVFFVASCFFCVCWIFVFIETWKEGRSVLILCRIAVVRKVGA